MKKEEFLQEVGREHYKSLYRFAKSICHDDELASEIVQNALEAAYLNADELRKCSNVKGWLYRAVRYQLMKRIDLTQRPGFENCQEAIEAQADDYDCIRLSEKRKSGKFSVKNKLFRTKRK